MVDASEDNPSEQELSRFLIAVGTYEGVLAGWQFADDELKIVFASPTHQGSVRALTFAKSHQLVSAGYDETVRIHDFEKRQTSVGQVQTTETPVGVSACGPHHVLVALTGSLVLYKRRDWSMQHVLRGHEGGTTALAVHPSAKLALSAGNDGKLKLWDLVKGRLAYASKVDKTHAIDCIVWNSDGSAFAFCYGSHLTVRDVASGSDLLDVELPSKVHQVCFLKDESQGLFVAAGCDDASLPILLVPKDDQSEERHAIMAIEPVDGPVAGEERYKCIQAVHGYQVATATSAGVVSLMDLSGAVRMVLADAAERDADDEDDDKRDQGSDDDDEDDDEELAVDIIASTQLGSGARVTCLAASYREDDESFEEEIETEEEATKKRKMQEDEGSKKKPRDKTDIVLNTEEMDKARKLVSEAKKIQKRKEKKKAKAARKV